MTQIMTVTRQVSRVSFQSTPCIKIVESIGGSPSKTTVFIDAKTLAPKYFEMNSGDTLFQKAIIGHGEYTLTETIKGVENSTKTTIPFNIYSSSSFSELIESNDFGKNRSVRFITFAPGRSPNQFVAERIGEKKMTILNHVQIDTWCFKFTKTDVQGKTSIAGYRYVDKKTGKVLLFKTNLNTDNYFTYQLLVFE